MCIIKRKWSEAQKSQIIQKVELYGLQETLRKYNLSQSLFHKWRRAYNGESFSFILNSDKQSFKTLALDLVCVNYSVNIIPSELYNGLIFIIFSFLSLFTLQTSCNPPIPLL